MQRILTSTDLGNGRTRYRVRIESDECANDLIEPIKQMLMRNFADSPHLLHCGPGPFQQLKMTHNGNIWIVEAEAIVETPNAKEQRNSASSEERGSKG